MEAHADVDIFADALTRRFGSEEAVAGIDLSVRRGTIFGFLGPNGAGKTTTVRILTTLLRPTSGAALVAGHDVVHERREVRRVIGAALQDHAIDELMTGRELIELHGALHGMSRSEVARRATELLDLLDLGALAGRRVREYSGGTRRKLDLVLALLHAPRVLFLDEPTTGLDPGSRVALWTALKEMNRSEGTTVFLTTQYIEEADRLAERVAFVVRGRIVAEETPARLKSTVARPIVSMLLADDADQALAEATVLRFGSIVPSPRGYVTVRLHGDAGGLESFTRALREAGVEVDALEWQSATLEDVFHELVGPGAPGFARS